MTDVYIVGAARTPIGRFLGSLSSVSAPELGAVAVRAAVERAGVDPGAVEDVIIGNVVQAGVGQAPARQAALGAGLPSSASATTINKVCASGLEAINSAALAIRNGDADVIVAGGMESMSRSPHLLNGARQGLRLGSSQLEDAVIHDGLWCPFEKHHMGNAAEAIAEKHGIGRAEMDEYALQSHRKAVAAAEAGRFDAEIAPVTVGWTDDDGGQPRREPARGHLGRGAGEAASRLPAGRRRDGRQRARPDRWRCRRRRRERERRPRAQPDAAGPRRGPHDCRLRSALAVRRAGPGDPEAARRRPAHPWTTTTWSRSTRRSRPRSWRTASRSAGTGTG